MVPPNHSLESTFNYRALQSQPFKSGGESLDDGIRPAAIAQHTNLIAALVLAFHNDPAIRWLYPDSYQYLTCFPDFVEAFGGKAFEQRTAYGSSTCAATALWYAPGTEPDSDSIVTVIQQTVVEAKHATVFAIFEQMERYHPSVPHWYLSLIGVDPTQQNKGYGAALMRPVLEQCDRDRIPAYLESSNPANISFYQRHGFEVLDIIRVGTSPPIIPMVRYPLNTRL